MAWATSNISPAGLVATFAGTFYSAGSFSANTVNVALYNNSVATATALTDTLAHNAYLGASGQWVSANELSTGSGYTVGGVTVTPKSETLTSNSAVMSSSGTPSWTSATFNTWGCLVYDNTITNKYAYCWNYFGGEQSVVSGTFTINWTSGIFSIAC